MKQDLRDQKARNAKKVTKPCKCFRSLAAAKILRKLFDNQVLLGDESHGRIPDRSAVCIRQILIWIVIFGTNSKGESKLRKG
jgi:hypothetical protein